MAVRLNLGAGLQHADGWINYDKSRSVLLARNPVARRLLGVLGKQPLDWPAHTHPHDVTTGIPHPDSSVDAIYTSHMLEHIRPEQVAFVLRECHRVLKPGGLLRVVVPDLRLAAERYLAGDREFFPRQGDGPMADLFVGSLHLRASPKGKAPERLVRRLLRTDEGGHRWMYDVESMSGRVHAAGFAEVREVNYREGADPAMAALDNRPRDSLHIEARK